LSGGRGRDELDGGGEDRLSGGRGEDRLAGDAGDDLLFGGGGADVFEFGRRDGADVVEDYADGSDLLDLREFRISGADEVLNGASQQGSDVYIDLGSQTTILLRDVTLAQLDGADFLL
jgi:Ca2+-binding RTX toxin-like protein